MDDVALEAVDHETVERAWTATALATGPADRPAAEAAVRALYAAAGLEPPQQVVWAGSPHAGAVAAAELGSGPGLLRSLRTDPWAARRAELHGRLGPAGWSRLWAVTGARSWPLVVDRIVTPLRALLLAELPPAARLAVLDAGYGQHDAAWLSAFAAADPGLGRLAPLAELSRSCGWWWAYPEVAILTERPVELHRDNVGRLHRADGPALVYPDGHGLRAWRGTPVPADLAVRLDHLSVAEIAGETNAELRRVMLEHFGYERYLREAGARQLGADAYGTLWRVHLPNDEPLVMVEVRNATPEPDGTVRTYWLRVPPTTRTAHEGVAWTFGLTAKEYRPLAQT